jgi:deoxyhypusine synthase
LTDPRDESRYGRGHEDGLIPLTPLDPSQANSVDALVRAMSSTAFGGRRLGEAADVLEAMVRDRNCFRVVTISGAMTVAKQGLVLCEMIERGWVQAVVTTGALMTHGLSEGAGMLHFKHRPDMRDEDLYDRGYNRVYDTIELEKNLDDVERILQSSLEGLSTDDPLSSRLVCERLGQELAHRSDGRAILKSAVLHDVPVYVPAFTDSELGLDLSIHNHLRAKRGEPGFRFDPFLDLDDFADRIRRHDTLGIFTIGGGVPRNWPGAGAPLQVRGAHLPGARALGRAVGLQLHRGRVLGEVRSRGRGRALRRGLRRRHHRLAPRGARRHRARLLTSLRSPTPNWSPP